MASNTSTHNTPTGYDFRVDRPLPLAEAVRRQCLHCVGEEPGEVRNCTATPAQCSLYPYRMGKGRDCSRDPSPPSRLRSVRLECERCMGGSRQAVRECGTYCCFLWPYRMGTNPNKVRNRPVEAPFCSKETGSSDGRVR